MSPLSLSLSLISLLIPTPSLSQNATVSCPLNFTILEQFTDSNCPQFDAKIECQYILQGIRLVDSHYLQLTGNFFPLLSAANSYWSAYQTLADKFVTDFDIRASCGFQTSWISQGCMNLTTKADFENLVGRTALDGVIANCNQSLENNSPCAACTTSLSATYLTGESIGNVSGCTAYPSIYAAAFANPYGPADHGNTKCFFQLVRISGVEGKWVKRALTALIRPSSH